MIENVVIMGAAGRDFHNFNVYFKGNPRYRVVAFTAAQIQAPEFLCHVLRLEACVASRPTGVAAPADDTTENCSHNWFLIES